MKTQSVCLYEKCNDPSRVRGLCKTHYDKCRNDGTLGRFPLTSTRHKLSEVNEETLTGLCSVCGYIELVTVSGRGQYGCKTRRDQSNQDFYFLKTYGVTVERKNQLIKEQNGLCALCKQPLDAGRIHLDHSHTTGKIRGVLHSKCNMGLGLFNDDVDLLKKAIAYLDEHEN